MLIKWRAAIAASCAAVAGAVGGDSHAQVFGPLKEGSMGHGMQLVEVQASGPLDWLRRGGGRSRYYKIIIHSVLQGIPQKFLSVLPIAQGGRRSRGHHRRGRPWKQGSFAWQ